LKLSLRSEKSRISTIAVVMPLCGEKELYAYTHTWKLIIIILIIIIITARTSPTQPPIQWVPGTLSPGAKRPRREADHSPSTSVEIQQMWLYTSTPPYVFMA
jgi:hypothetical protein